MKVNYLFIILLATSISTQAQTIWDGEDISFSKEPNADFTLAENQDRITDNVWITRGNNMGIYNIAVESVYNDEVSPSDTEWAFGTTADIETLTFENWVEAIDANPPGSIDMPMVLHLITDDIYIDLTFTQWGQGNGGGGSFAYTRSSDPDLSVSEINNPAKGLFPNPAQSIISLPNLKQESTFEVYDVLGKRVLSGKAIQDKPIDISALKSGVYFIQVLGSPAERFVKL